MRPLILIKLIKQYNMKMQLSMKGVGDGKVTSMFFVAVVLIVIIICCINVSLYPLLRNFFFRHLNSNFDEIGYFTKNNDFLI